jgi:hypothetical protein
VCGTRVARQALPVQPRARLRRVHGLPRVRAHALVARRVVVRRSDAEEGGVPVQSNGADVNGSSADAGDSSAVKPAQGMLPDPRTKLEVR